MVKVVCDKARQLALFYSLILRNFDTCFTYKNLFVLTLVSEGLSPANLLVYFTDCHPINLDPTNKVIHM